MNGKGLRRRELRLQVDASSAEFKFWRAKELSLSCAKDEPTDTSSRSRLLLGVKHRLEVRAASEEEVKLRSTSL